MTAEKLVLTKHISAVEDEFPGTGRIRPGNENAENGQPSRTDKELRLADTDNGRLSVGYMPGSESDGNDDDDDDSPDGPAQDPFTYVPPKPSSFGETDDESEESSVLRFLSSEPLRYKSTKAFLSKSVRLH